MGNNFTKKIIPAFLIIMVLFPYFYPTKAQAVVGTQKLNWENPNKSGYSNPYRFKIKDTLNSSLIMNVVGCTGIVNKVSSAVTGFAQKEVNKIVKRQAERAAEKMAEAGIKAAGVGVSPTPVAGPGLSTAIVDINYATQKTSDAELTDEQRAIKAKLEAQARREECFNGIAYTLAKNQLTSMTRSAMNWVSSGFNGDPMYVQNTQSFMNSITNEILEEEINLFKDKADYPFGMSYGRNSIMGYRSMNNFYGSMKQSLTNYLNVDLGETNYMDKYSQDFSLGGWNGWLAFTQKPQNNPFGFYIETSQYIEDKKRKEIEDIKEQQTRNGGILDQKKCVKYASSVNKGANSIASSLNKYNSDEFNEKILEAKDSLSFAQKDYDKAYSDLMADPKNKTRLETFKMTESTLKNAQKTYNNILAQKSDINSNILTQEGDECTEWEVVTPGSLIKDKISTYINSPERQLELADTINEALNSLFTMLISKLQHNGLSSLRSDTEEFADTSSGRGSNKIYDTDGNDITSYGSGGFSGPFDITKDLGNIYTKPFYMGKWDAKTNTTTNPSELILSSKNGVQNTYYIVSVAGNTVLDGQTSWKVGDEVFFDGEKWKKGIPDYVIEKRGIIQLQQDYINNAQKVLSIIPKVMPSIGELDYCIPGPNPNWEGNSADAYGAYSDWLYGIALDTKVGGFLERDSARIILPTTESAEYRNYKSLFYDYGNKLNETLWNKIKESSLFNSGSVQGKYAESKKLWNASYGDYIHPFDRINHTCNGQGDMFDWKGQKCMTQAQERIDQSVEKIMRDLESKFASYKQNFLSKYGNRSPLNDPTSNTYLEMAQAGTNITKNIKQYDEAIREASINYEDAISDACSNIYKLNAIKEEVNKIVKAAQARRDQQRKDSGEKAIDASCKEAELGSYMSDDNDKKILLKGCGNSKIENPVSVTNPGIGTNIVTANDGVFENYETRSDDDYYKTQEESAY